MTDRKTRLTHEGAAFLSVLLGAVGLSHEVRDMGRGTGHVSASGAGTWGLLNSIARDGPQTVPVLARERPVSRQYMQQVVNEAMADGLVRLASNPRHKRSSLVELTNAGRARYDDLTRSLAAIATDLSRGMDVAMLEQAASVLAEAKRRVGRLKG
jgi:DNA-binding MarR family transcriptional regulator